MDKQTAENVLRCPDKVFVEFVLSLVNLTDKEEAAIRLVGIKDIKDERAAEMMNLSVRHTQRIIKDAFEKVCAVWDGRKIIEYMASIPKDTALK